MPRFDPNVRVQRNLVVGGRRQHIVRSGKKLRPKHDPSNKPQHKIDALSLSIRQLKKKLDTLSSSGLSTTIPHATPTGAGVMTAADNVKLGGIEAGAQKNVDTDLGLGTDQASSVEVTSSTGAGVTLPAATTARAGVMAAADKLKLDTLPPGTNLGRLASHDVVQVLSSTGSSTELPGATHTHAGVMTAADKLKLDNMSLTDLDATFYPTAVDVTSTGGSRVVLIEATNAHAGVMTAADKGKLDSVNYNAEENVPTNLQYANQTATTLDITSSTGTSATLPSAQPGFAGLMSAADKAKVDSDLTEGPGAPVESGALTYFNSATGTLLGDSSFVYSDSDDSLTLPNTAVPIAPAPGKSKLFARLGVPQALTSDGDRYSMWPTFCVTVCPSSSPVSLVTGLWATITDYTSVVDVGLDMHLGLGEFTAPKAGLYLFVGMVCFEAHASGRRCVRLLQNGAVEHEGATSVGDSTGETHTNIIEHILAAAGDTFVLQGRQTSNSTLQAHGKLTVRFLGQY